jgi:hypothetical protein
MTQEVTMPNTWFAIVALVIGLLQAWDSNAFEADAFTQLLVIVAVLIPPVAMAATRDMRVRGAALLAAAVLLSVTRRFADVHLPGLVLAAFFPAAMVLLDYIRSLNTSRTHRAE